MGVRIDEIGMRDGGGNVDRDGLGDLVAGAMPTKRGIGSPLAVCALAFT